MSCLIETTYFKKLFVLLKKCISLKMNKKKRLPFPFSIWKLNVKGQQFEQVRFFSCHFIYLIIKLIFCWKLHRVLFCHAILINYVLKDLTFLFYLYIENALKITLPYHLTFIAFFRVKSNTNRNKFRTAITLTYYYVIKLCHDAHLIWPFFFAALIRLRNRKI